MQDGHKTCRASITGFQPTYLSLLPGRGEDTDKVLTGVSARCDVPACLPAAPQRPLLQIDTPGDERLAKLAPNICHYIYINREMPGPFVCEDERDGIVLIVSSLCAPRALPVRSPCAPCALPVRARPGPFVYEDERDGIVLIVFLPVRSLCAPCALPVRARPGPFVCEDERDGIVLIVSSLCAPRALPVRSLCAPCARQARPICLRGRERWDRPYCLLPVRSLCGSCALSVRSLYAPCARQARPICLRGRERWDRPDCFLPGPIHQLPGARPAAGGASRHPILMFRAPASSQERVQD
uniref:Uncharacterized protein n=1 Tax=Branchiostoma floridae TaxID=7739 RepID=C3YA77_BRAFL|eukprot:XP_002606615.1 hypothetical protein BRAFLDRAFT_72637 [Branchiostoma floridae]